MPTAAQGGGPLRGSLRTLMQVEATAGFPPQPQQQRWQLPALEPHIIDPSAVLCCAGAGSAAAKAAVLSIVKGGLTYALQAISLRALFLPYALGPLTVRLSPEDAAAVAEELEQRSEELRQQQQQGEDSDDEEAAAWSGLEMYMQGLQVITRDVTHHSCDTASSRS